MRYGGDGHLKAWMSASSTQCSAGWPCPCLAPIMRRMDSFSRNLALEEESLTNCGASTRAVVVRKGSTRAQVRNLITPAVGVLALKPLLCRASCKSWRALGLWHGLFPSTAVSAHARSGLGLCEPCGVQDRGRWRGAWWHGSAGRRARLAQHLAVTQGEKTEELLQIRMFSLRVLSAATVRPRTHELFAIAGARVLRTYHVHRDSIPRGPREERDAIWRGRG